MVEPTDLGQAGESRQPTVTPEMFMAADEARRAYLEDVDPGDQAGALDAALRACMQVWYGDEAGAMLHPSAGVGTKRKVLVSLFLDREEDQDLIAIALGSRRSVAEVVRDYLDAGIAAHKAGQGGS